MISTFFFSIIFVFPYDLKPAKITALLIEQKHQLYNLIPIGIFEEIIFNGKLYFFLVKKVAPNF